MALAFATVDVFTQRAFAGNPLAVVRGADALDATAMQAIAREFNLSETVFVLRPENPSHTAKLRIFTPHREIPFAGHPTIGTAVVLARDGHAGDAERRELVVLEEGIGLVRVGVVLNAGSPAFAEFDLPSLPEKCDVAVPVDKLARALGVMAPEIGFANHKPSAYDAGLAYLFVPLRDRDALSSVLPSGEMWAAALGGNRQFAAYAYTRCPDQRAGYEARMFDPATGMAEDPATGSAAAAFASVVERFDGPGDGRHVINIAQGRDMGRPGLIRLEVEFSAGRLHMARVGGCVVAVSSGEISV